MALTTEETARGIRYMPMSNDEIIAETKKCNAANLDVESAALMVGSLLFGVAMQSLLDPMMDLERLRLTVVDTVRLGFAA